MSDPTAKAPTRILLIEDNPDDAVFVEVMLAQAKGFPYHLVTAGTLAEGQQRLAEGELDLVLLDSPSPTVSASRRWNPRSGIRLTYRF